MTRQLTPKSSLDVLKKDAKRWLKALRASDSTARSRLNDIWPKAPAEPSLRDVQHALALEHGLPDWRLLLSALDDLAVDRQSYGERIEAVLRHGWDGDAVLARRIVNRYPEIARENLCCAATCGDVAEVRRHLSKNAALANEKAGSREWTPLTGVTYGRLDAQNAVSICSTPAPIPILDLMTDGATRSRCLPALSDWAKA